MSEHCECDRLHAALFGALRSAEMSRNTLNSVLGTHGIDPEIGPAMDDLLSRIDSDDLMDGDAIADLRGLLDRLVELAQRQTYTEYLSDACSASGTFEQTHLTSLGVRYRDAHKALRDLETRLVEVQCEIAADRLATKLRT